MPSPPVLRPRAPKLTDTDAPPQVVLTVSAAAAGERLDRWLATALPDQSRSAIQRWIKEGLVTVDGAPARASLKLAAGQSVAATPPAVAPAPGLAPEATPLAIVYEDDDLLVIDKPAGMVVHPAPGHAAGTLVNAVLHHCPDIAGVGGERRPGIVHRLDKETSGLIVVAKHDAAQRYVQAQFKDRTVFKEYLTLLDGRLEPPDGRIVTPIGRHPTDRKRMAVIPPDAPGHAAARAAVTEYHVRSYLTGVPLGGSTATASFSYVSAVLHTGRTHQIRVHFAWLRHPVVGDTVYGLRAPRLPVARQFLHACRLRLRLPGDGQVHEFAAPLPADLQAVLDALA